MGYFFIGLLLLAVMYAVIWTRGRDGWLTLRIALGAGRRRAEDVSAREAPVPPELKHHISVLEGLGFERLGEVEVKIPGARAAGSRLFLSADRRTFAELTDAQIVLFVSVFPDDAVVETGFPVGENINARNFRSHTVTAGLEQAHRHHAAQIGAFAGEHGAPRPVGTMQDYLEWDAMYRRRHVGRKMRRHTLFALAQLLTLLYGVLALAAGVIYWLGTDKSTVEPMILITTLLMLAVLPDAVIAFFLPFMLDRGSRRASKEK
jgi:hypothetical protein